MNHVLTALFAACTDALAPLGLSLVLDMSCHDDPVAQADAWAGLAPAAVLDLVLHHDDAALARLRARGVPILSAAPAGETEWESSGDRFAREQRLAQVRHLVGRGHRSIRWVVPTLTSQVDPRTAQRLEDEIRAVATAGGAELEIEQVALDDLAAAVATWDRLPGAVMAHNDSYALAVLTALQHRGVRVPDDVAVIGADDEPAARAVTPGLTTVAGDFRAFADAAAEAVLAGLTGKAVTALPVPGVVVVERASA
jgi:DNA-binding LacI/PurR family transcriptional regulator